MKTETKNRKIILGHNGAKGYEIKNVMSSGEGNNKTEVYVSKEAYDNYINAGERDQEAFFAGFSGEANEIIKEIEALEDIDTQLFGLHCTLEHAITLPYGNMRERVKDAMKHINAIRAEHSENTQEKLDQLLAGQQKADANKDKALVNTYSTQAQPERPSFEYKEHTNLIDDAAGQLAKYYSVSFMDARGAMEQAIKEAQLDKYERAKDSATHKIDFKEVVMYADTLLRTGFKNGINFLNGQEIELTNSKYYDNKQYPF